MTSAADSVLEFLLRMNYSLSQLSKRYEEP